MGGPGIDQETAVESGRAEGSSTTSDSGGSTGPVDDNVKGASDDEAAGKE